MQDVVQIIQRHSRWASVGHDPQDPDSMGVCYFFNDLSYNLGVENNVALHSGSLRHPKNRKFQKLFNIPLVNYSSKTRKKQKDPYTNPQSFDKFIFADHHGQKCTWYTKGKIKDKDIGIIIDHHNGSQFPNADFIDYREVGAASTICGDYLKQGLAEYFRNEQFKDICTALYLGIMTDTNHLETGRATEKDYEISDFLLPHTNEEKIKAFQNVKYPKSWEAKRKNAHNYLKEIGDYVLTTTGIMGNGNTEVMPEEADKLQQLYKEDKRAVFVFGIENNKLRLCVRTSNGNFNEYDMHNYFPELQHGGFNNSGAGGYQESLKDLMPQKLRKESNLTKLEWLFNYFVEGLRD